MKSIYVFLFLIVASLITPFGHKANALSCAPSYPIIGTISEITTTELGYEIVLDNLYTFDISNFTSDQIINIDEYETTVNAYIKNNFRLSEQPNLELNHWLNKIVLPTQAANKFPPKKGDIIINGPAFHVCSYGFIGVFTNNGTLEYASINDKYADYSYHGATLIVDPGKTIECAQDDICKMEVNYNLPNESFSLSPGQSHTSPTGPIKSISLINSSDLKKRSDGTTVFDWGFGTYVNHLIYFQNELFAEPHAPLPGPIVETEINIFQKIINWLLSFFK